MSKLSEYIEKSPEGLQPIYWACAMFSGYLQQSNSGELDVNDIRKIKNETRDRYVFQGWPLQSQNLDQMKSFHSAMVENGELGLAFLTADMMWDITQLKADFREESKQFKKLAIEDASLMWTELQNDPNPVFEAALQVSGQEPQHLLTLHKLDQALSELELDENTDENSDCDSVLDEESLNNPDDVWDTYKHVLRNPVVCFCRSALDGNEQDRFEVLEEVALKPPELASPFIPISLESNRWGGSNLTLLFVEHPDSLWRAWIYGDESRGFELRGLHPMDNVEQETIDLLLCSPFVKRAIDHAMAETI